MTRVWILGVFLLALMTSVAACEDEDDGGIFSGVDASKQLDEMSYAESQRLCEEFVAAPEEVFNKDAMCRFAGFSAARVLGNSTDICNVTYDLCMKSSLTDAVAILPELMGAFFDCDPDKFDNDGEHDHCSATVGELEKCANDVIYAYESVIGQMRCDSLEVVDLPSKPASCEIVMQKCPGLNDDKHQ